MEMHPKKRIDIVLEAPVLKRLTDLLDRLDVTGYTVLPVIGGKGHHGVWSREGLPSAAGTMVSITVIAAAENLDAVLDPVFALVKRHIGIVTVSDVTVLRGDHF
jgi:nitrogen regulatory protein PII